MTAALRIAFLSSSAGVFLLVTPLFGHLPLPGLGSLALPLPGPPAASPQDLRSLTGELLDQTREASALPSLHAHRGMETSLAEALASTPAEAVDLPLLFGSLERRHPEIREFAANLVVGRNAESLARRMSEWEEVKRPGFSSYALHVFETPQGRIEGCLAVLSRSLPPLTLPAPSSASAEFHAQCRRCGRGHGLALRNRTHSTLIIRCPHCRRSYDLIAVDSDNQWRRANQFLTGLPILESRSEGSEHDRILHLWKTTTEAFRYRRDAQRIGGSDSWELPARTLAARSGDCEDVSLLLADVLLSHGFEARVVLGHHDGEGHAWCVVRADGHEYLLESTGGYPQRRERLPRIADLALEYEPHILFDRTRIWFKDFPGWTGQYWSEEIWTPVDYGEGAGKDGEVARMEVQAGENG